MFFHDRRRSNRRRFIWKLTPTEEYSVLLRMWSSIVCYDRAWGRKIFCINISWFEKECWGRTPFGQCPSPRIGTIEQASFRLIKWLTAPGCRIEDIDRSLMIMLLTSKNKYTKVYSQAALNTHQKRLSRPLSQSFTLHVCLLLFLKHCDPIERNKSWVPVAFWSQFCIKTNKH